MSEYVCKFEDKVIQLCEDAAAGKQAIINLDTRINGSLNAIDKHINHGHVWRVTIFGIAATLIINMVLVANLFGKTTQKLDDLDEKLTSHIQKTEKPLYRVSPIILEE